ncbi:MAG: inositol monophosphatase [Halobacteriovoraceae bacterium]|nr:inositol monophosphatase [Halobacteriovoraceae bacterium]
MAKNKVLDSKKLKLLLKEVLPVVEAAGKKLVKHQKKIDLLKIDVKEAQGLVSNADVESENFLIKKLRPLVKGVEFLAEESAFAQFGNKKEAYLAYKKKEYTWIIDPLDGTSNFLSNLDYYCICICLAYFGEPILGIVHRPSSGETFYAIKGEGAFHTQIGKKNKKLDISQSKGNLKSHLLVTGFACEKGEVFDKEFTSFKKIMSKSRGIRRMGSAALDMALVSQGIFGAFWERGLAPWDVAASSLIVKEAGGKVTDYEGQRFNPFQETIIASNKKIHGDLKALLET